MPDLVFAARLAVATVLVFVLTAVVIPGLIWLLEVVL